MQATMKTAPMSDIFRFSSPSVRPLRRRTRDDPGAKGGRTWYVSAGRAILSKFFGIFPTFAAVRIRPIPLLFALLALLLMTACRGRYPSSLLTADSLASACPDSALRLLRALEPEMKEAGTATRMYYNLLCIKAEDKAYVPHASDSAVQEVLRYYVDRNDRRHLPEAYYYAGRVTSDLGDTPQALDYFEHALKALPRDGQLTLRSRILSQMGTLFYRQGMYPEALNMHKKSLSCDSLLGDSAGMIFSLRDIGNCYDMLGKTDSTLRYYRQAYQYSKALQHPELLSDIQDCLSRLYLDKQAYDSARIFLHAALQNGTTQNKTIIYNTAGMYYQTIGMLDSAAWYYSQVLKSNLLYAKLVASGNQAQIVLAQGDPDAAIQYLRQYLLYTDSIQRITNTEGIRKMYALYNYQLREKENDRLREANMEAKRRNISLIIGILLLITAAIVYYRKREKTWNARLKATEQLKNEAYQQSEQHIQDNEKEIARLQAKLQDVEHELQNKEQYLQTKEQELQHLSQNLQTKEHSLQDKEAELQAAQQSLTDSLTERKQLENQIGILANLNQQVKLQQDSRKLAEDILFHSEIYRHFRQQLKTTDKKSRLSAQDWTDLQTEVDKCYDNFTDKLNGSYQLNDRELRICLLLKLKFTCTEIGELVHLTQSGVSSVRRRLYYKVFGQKGEAKSWDKFIFSL